MNSGPNCPLWSCYLVMQTRTPRRPGCHRPGQRVKGGPGPCAPKPQGRGQATCRVTPSGGAGQRRVSTAERQGGHRPSLLGHISAEFATMAQGFQIPRSRPIAPVAGELTNNLGPGQKQHSTVGRSLTQSWPRQAHHQEVHSTREPPQGGDG